ncbi:hypothetical protein [Streptomyces sp. NPDC087297]|uniref:hypothetical protein n=1 Tax=Streptomyces sp. NPDC087297 TaxID=3365778 RepID=UPI003804D505
MSERYFELNVPIRSTDRGQRGVHVFTCRADCDSADLQAAHEVYDAARAAAAAGREMPHGRPDGWGSCGYRPGWELDWPAAKAGPRRNPYSWFNSSPIEL